ncbi:MAG TPA: Lrp/AsnC ligand binding domain-containing protein, partial [Candidatus Thermoplasmatota archaeon]
LIRAAPTREHDVYRALLSVREIVEIVPLFGDFDMIARLDAPTLEGMEQIVKERIRPAAGVAHTKVLVTTKF